jgi:ubiquinone/menaquinone biosynthesis C-methylase UbiE
VHAVPEGRESPKGRLETWRLERRADKLARRPYGRAARKTYGDPRSHDFLWPDLLEALDLTKEDRLLDVGCGGGAFIRHVRETIGCTVAGLDHSRQMVKLAAPYAALGAAEAMPFQTEYFTALSSIQAFMFFADPLQVLREMRRVLDPEVGRGAIWTTAPEGRGTPAAPEPIGSLGHYHSDEELLALAYDAGFADAEIAQRDEWAQLVVIK